MRQSRCLMGFFSRNKSLMEFSRNYLRCVTGLLTGHCQMRRHMHILGLSQDPECHLCLEDEETRIHVLTQCPALATIRKELWGKSVINPLDIWGTRPRRLCQCHRTGKVLACDGSQWARLVSSPKGAHLTISSSSSFSNVLVQLFMRERDLCHGLELITENANFRNIPEFPRINRRLYKQLC